MDFAIKGRGQGKVQRKTGLDIGSFSVKILSAVKSDGKLSLSGYGMKNLSGKSKSAVTDAIRAIVSESGIIEKQVAISVSGPSVVVRFISMPKMSDDELKGAVRFEAEKFIPYNISDCVIDYQVVSRDAKDNKMTVMIAIAKKDLILERISMVEGAGLSVRVIDVETFALANCFLANFPSVQKERTIALLDIGANVTNVCFITNGNPCFVRDVGIGSGDLNEALAKALNVKADEVERLKIDPKENEAQLSACSRSVLGSLCDDVKLSFGYYENQCGKTVDEVYVSGGASGFSGLEKILEDSFSIKPVIWDPLKFIDASSSGLDVNKLSGLRSYFAIAAGLLLR